MRVITVSLELFGPNTKTHAQNGYLKPKFGQDKKGDKRPQHWSRQKRKETCSNVVLHGRTSTQIQPFTRANFLLHNNLRNGGNNDNDKVAQGKT